MMASLNEVKRVVMEIAVGSIECILSSDSVVHARDASQEFSVPESGRDGRLHLCSQQGAFTISCWSVRTMECVTLLDIAFH
jgi:hypothetical protein